MNYRERIGATIKRLRKEQVLSQQSLATLTGLGHQQTVLRIENGGRRISLEEAVRIAAALGCSLDDLVEAARAELIDSTTEVRRAVTERKIAELKAQLEELA